VERASGDALSVCAQLQLSDHRLDYRWVLVPHGPEDLPDLVPGHPVPKKVLHGSFKFAGRVRRLQGSHDLVSRDETAGVLGVPIHAHMMPVQAVPGGSSGARSLADGAYFRGTEITRGRPTRIEGAVAPHD
jgi:hypothetical protein